MPAVFEANGRRYAPPDQPIVVICIDGCGDEYLSVSINRGRMPHMERMARNGYRGLVRGVVPTFTNVNNASIVTGVPPAINGVSGNFFLNPETGEEVMMNSPEYRRCGTLLTAAADAGRKVAFITAKEKLRTVLGDGIVERGGIAFSSEKVDEARQETHGVDDAESIIGRPRPEIYSADASVYVLEAGAALLAQHKADFLYLSLTDYMQHKFAPEEPESLEFHAAMDEQIGRLLDAGCIIAATADHGMNAKNRDDGTPNVIYVESLLSAEFGEGCRVICPVTDPYVVHHGSLGALVMVHLDQPAMAGEVAKFLFDQEGVTEVLTRDQAAAKLELPADRIGDLVVLSGRSVVLGKTPEYHNLKVLHQGLRSHGGRYEEMVPLVISHPLKSEYIRKAQGDPRNFDVFDFACNGTC
ncbi:MAG: phosphonoacetate hydrolase [Fuerstiella sp.]|nr:phosphonoacetate hydrolase [Fuerstiella sp.]